MRQSSVCARELFSVSCSVALLRDLPTLTHLSAATVLYTTHCFQGYYSTHCGMSSGILPQAVNYTASMSHSKVFHRNLHHAYMMYVVLQVV